MSADSLSIPAESLLEHREFVRRLARSLVRDEHAAQDVVQETWLEALRRPPSSASGIRAWLARVVRTRAQNAARGESRRALRERAAARDEADASEAQLRERVALQHKVVEAVLGLKEPYRAVVLLHYYEGLTPSAIAARRGSPAGTVRAQLTRAHEQLRERLDAEFGGSRASWCAGLALLARGRHAALAPKLALLGAIGAAVAVPAILWIARPAYESAALPVASNLGQPAEATVASEPSFEPEPVRMPAARSAVPAEPAAAQILPKEELEKKSVRQLLQLAIGIQQIVRTKLLTPSDEWKQRSVSLLALPNTGIARILKPDRYGTFESNALGIRGAGTCFSFQTQKPSWDDEPDISLDRNEVRVAGWGPGVLDLGEGSLEDMPTSADPAPRAIGEREREWWDVHWADAGSTEGLPSEDFQRRRNELRSPPARAVEGHVYLVRGFSPNTHDLLGAIRLLAEDEDGWTFAWRVLRTWPVHGSGGQVADPYWLAADPPDFLQELRVDALVDLLARVRAAARAQLYRMPENVASKYAKFDGGEKGVTRILARGRYNALVDGREGGAYFSFATKTNDYDREPDLCLDMNSYASRFYGAHAGFLLDLGETPIEAVGDDPGRVPAGLSASNRSRWDLMWRVSAFDQGARARAISREDEEAAESVRLESRAGPALGHTYLLRSILPGEHDVLAVFTTAARDEHGDWIAYRVIWNRKLDPDPKPR